MYTTIPFTNNIHPTKYRNYLGQRRLQSTIYTPSPFNITLLQFNIILKFKLAFKLNFNLKFNFKSQHFKFKFSTKTYN